MMNARAEQNGSYLGGRPYSPSDVMNYDLSSDECVIRTSTEQRTKARSSSSSSDSSDDSTSSYEYRWEEARPPKPPFVPSITLIYIGQTELPAIQRESLTIVPLKTIFEVLFPQNDNNDLERLSKLGIHQLTKFEADLMTNYVRNMHISIITGVKINDKPLTEFKRGDIAFSCQSLKDNYKHLIESLPHNPKREDEPGKQYDCDTIRKDRTLSTTISAWSSLILATSLKSSNCDDECAKLSKLTPNTASQTSWKTSYCDGSSASKTKYSLHVDISNLKNEKAIPNAGCTESFERFSSRPNACENNTYGPGLSSSSSDMRRKNGVVLKHLFPENEDENSELELSEIMVNAKAKRKSKKSHKKQTLSSPCRLGNYSEIQERRSSPGTQNTIGKSSSAEMNVKSYGSENDVISSQKSGVAQNEELCIAATISTLRALTNDPAPLKESRADLHSDQEKNSLNSVSVLSAFAPRMVSNKRNTVKQSTSWMVEDSTRSTIDIHAESSSFRRNLPQTQHDSAIVDSLACAGTKRNRVESRVNLGWTSADSYVRKSPERNSSASIRSESESSDALDLGLKETSDKGFCLNSKSSLLEKFHDKVYPIKVVMSGTERPFSGFSDVLEDETTTHKQDAKSRRELDVPIDEDKKSSLSSCNSSSKDDRKKVITSRHLSEGKGAVMPTSRASATESRRLGASARFSGKKHVSREIAEDKDSRRRTTTKSNKSSPRRRISKNDTTRSIIQEKQQTRRLPYKATPDRESCRRSDQKKIPRDGDAPHYLAGTQTKPYQTNYSNLRYTYDVSLYSPISSDDADFGSSDNFDERKHTRKPKNSPHSSRNGSRQLGRMDSLKDPNTHHDLSKSRSDRVLRYPITRIDDDKDETTTVTPNLVLKNPSNSQLKASVQNLVVSIRRQCNRDVSVVETSPPRRVMLQRSPKRRQMSNQRRRRSLSPSRARSISPDALRRQVPIRRQRSLSPIRSTHSREKSGTGRRTSGNSSKFLKRHRRETVNSRVNSSIDNARTADEVGNVLRVTHNSEVRYSSPHQSSRSSYSRAMKCDSTGSVATLPEDIRSAQSAFRNVKQAQSILEKRVIHGSSKWDRRCSAHGRSEIQYDLLPPIIDSAMEEEEIVIIKKSNPIEEAWPFFSDSSDVYSSSTDDDCEGETRSFMIGKWTALLRSRQTVITEGLSPKSTGFNCATVEASAFVNVEPSVGMLGNSDQPNNKPLYNVEGSVSGYSLTAIENADEHEESNSASENIPPCKMVADETNRSCKTLLENESDESYMVPILCTGVVQNNNHPDHTDEVNGEFVEAEPGQPPVQSKNSSNEKPFAENTKATDEHTVVERHGELVEDATELLQSCDESKEIFVDENVSSGGLLDHKVMNQYGKSTPIEDIRTTAYQQLSAVVELVANVESPCAYEEVTIASDHTIDKANLELTLVSSVDAKAVESVNEMFRPSDQDQKSATLNDDCKQVCVDSPLACSLEVESMDVGEGDGICLGATITVEDDKCAQSVLKETGDVKSWKKILLRKAQNTAVCNGGVYSAAPDECVQGGISTSKHHTSVPLPTNITVPDRRYTGSVSPEQFNTSCEQVPGNEKQSKQISDNRPKSNDEPQSATSDSGIIPVTKLKQLAIRDEKHQSSESRINAKDNKIADVIQQDSSDAVTVLADQEEFPEGVHSVNNLSSKNECLLQSSKTKSLHVEKVSESESKSVVKPHLADISIAVSSPKELEKQSDIVSMAVDYSKEDLSEKLSPAVDLCESQSDQAHDNVKNLSTGAELSELQFDQVKEQSEKFVAVDLAGSKAHHANTHSNHSDTQPVQPDEQSEKLAVSMNPSKYLPSQDLVVSDNALVVLNHPKSLSVSDVARSQSENSSVTAVHSDFYCDQTHELTNTISVIVDHPESLMKKLGRYDKMSVAPSCSESVPCQERSERIAITLDNSKSPKTNALPTGTNKSEICEKSSQSPVAGNVTVVTESREVDEIYDKSKETELNPIKFDSNTSTILTSSTNYGASNFTPCAISVKLQPAKSKSALSSSRIFANAASSITIVNQPVLPTPPVGLANKGAFRGPSIKIKSKAKEMKTILAKPWDNTEKSKPEVLHCPSIVDMSSLTTATCTSQQSVNSTTTSTFLKEPDKNHSCTIVKPLKSILLNRNVKCIGEKSIETVQKDSSKLGSGGAKEPVRSNQTCGVVSKVMTNVEPEVATTVLARKSKKRKVDSPLNVAKGAKMKKKKTKRSPLENSKKLPQSDDLTRVQKYAEIVDNEFMEGDKVIDSLLPLIKIRGKYRKRRQSSSGQSRGRSKRRGRLPSISSDDDLIDELNAVVQQQNSEENSTAQNEICGKSDDDESDDGLVSFMGIIRNLDTIVPIVPDVKQEADLLLAADEVNVITDTDNSDNEGVESSKSLIPSVNQKSTIHPDNDEAMSRDMQASEPRNLENIFTKMSKEMEEMEKLQFSSSWHDDTVKENDTAKSSSSSLPTSLKKVNLGAFTTNAVGFATSNSEENIANNPTYGSETLIELQVPVGGNCKADGTLPAAVLTPNLLTPPTSPKPERPYKANGIATLNAEVKPVEQPFIEVSTPSTAKAETPLCDGNMVEATSRCAPSDMRPIACDILRKNQTNPKENSSIVSNLIATAAQMAGVSTCVLSGLNSTSDDRVMQFPERSSDAVGGNEFAPCSDGISAITRSQSKTKSTIKPLSTLRMPSGRSCHGFLEVCLSGLECGNKVTYALRRIPYVRTVSSMRDNETVEQQQSLKKDELGGVFLGATSTIATYLRLRDVICMLKIHAECLYSLTTRCEMDLFYPNAYAIDLFTTVYDPVGKLDSIIAKMTMRHSRGVKLQKFLDHMIILDKFLHCVLPRFYAEALDIRTLDVPNLVNVKIFKPIFDINEEVVKIFRKPYEYNSVLWKKDHPLPTKPMIKQMFSAVPLRRVENVKLKSRFCHPPTEHSSFGSANLDQSCFTTHTSSMNSQIVANPRFSSHGQSIIMPSALSYPGFSRLQRFPNHLLTETNILHNHLPPSDVPKHIMPRTSPYDFDERPCSKTLHCANIRLSRTRNEHGENPEGRTPLLPVKLGTGTNLLGSTLTQYRPHNVGERGIWDVNASSCAVDSTLSFQSPAYAYFHSGNNVQTLQDHHSPPQNNAAAAAATTTATHCFNKELRSMNIESGTGNVGTGAQTLNVIMKSGIDMLAEAAAAVSATEERGDVVESKTGRNMRSGPQTRHSSKIVNALQAGVNPDDQLSQKAKKRKLQNISSTRKSATRVRKSKI